jgi:hypothetical protein
MPTRKPVHIERAAGNASPRERIWDAIRKLKADFTTNDLRGETGLSLGQIREYLECLEASGHVKKSGERRRASGSRMQPTYSLEIDCGIDAPRVRADGSEVTQGQGRESLWTAMKILKLFEVRTVAELAQTSVNDAEHFTTALLKAGYLKLIRQAKPGRRAIYQFFRDTGPKAPMIQRAGKQVFDPNLGQVVWPRAEVCDG